METSEKLGLVLEGGAMRGMFTAGVLDVFLARGLRVDGAVGVSAGAAFGCNYKSHQIGRAIRYNKRYCKDPRYCSLRSLWRTGDLYGGEFCYHTLPTELDPFDVEAYLADPMEFHLVCTDLATGQPVYHLCDDLDDRRTFEEWFRASASMPLVSKPVEIDGQKYLDGGVSDSIPLRYFERIGNGRNIVVLTQPEDYRKGKNKALPLIRLQLRKYPQMVERIARRHIEYNDTLDYLREREAAGAILILRPDGPLPIGRTEKDPARLEEVYQLGRGVALREWDRIAAFAGPERLDNDRED